MSAVSQRRVPWNGRLWLLVLLLAAAALTTVIATDRRQGEQSGARIELRGIQSAVSIMMIHNNITLLPHPVSEPTNDMRRFPDVATSVQEKGLLEGDKGGYALYGHDNTPNGRSDAAVDYLRFPETDYAYSVTIDGVVIQWDKPGE